MTTDAREQRLAELQDRLTTLQDAMAQLQDLIARLANFDFQPGAVPLGAGDDDNVSAELGAEIIQVLREQNEDLELLEEEIASHRPPHHHDKERLRDGVERLKGELQSCRVAFRKAQMAAKRNREAAQRRERQLLLASLAAPKSPPDASSPVVADQPAVRRRKPLRSEMTKEEQMVAASSDVTLSLKRTHDLMVAELSRSDFAHTTLKESTAALAQLSESYSSLDSILASSRDLLGTLLKSQKSDTWYLETSFYLLAGTISWLVFRRFLYGPMWWLLWLPLKMVFRVGVSVSGTVSRSDAQAHSPGGPSGVAPGQPSAVMNNEGVPTIRVSEEKAPEPRGEAATGMIEEVGRIIDESQQGMSVEEQEEIARLVDEAKHGRSAEEALPEDHEMPPEPLMEQVLEADQAEPAVVDGQEMWGERARDEL